MFPNKNIKKTASVLPEDKSDIPSNTCFGAITSPEGRDGTYSNEINVLMVWEM